ncbi:Rrf2 family transcriptional regulator [Roseateles sp.]|uniref:Rrf2 family transcriptional regulator n=1 Tax=Roseateles sp. TaxID=1971397 RepID=UPI003264BA08
MKLTAFTDYSLRVLIYLAAEPERRVTIMEVTTAFDISENHLTKVVHFLGKHGWIATVRGKGGGMRLAMPATEISIGKVVRDTEGAAMPAECFSDEASDCAIVSCCQLKGVLREAVHAFYAVLDRHTLADITKNRAALTSILRFRRPAVVTEAGRV